MTFTVIIPARYASTRLPGKPLLDISGQPLIEHVYQKAQQSGASRVIIATDDARIEAAAKSFGAEVCLTAAHHRSGTERIAEVLQTLRYLKDEVVVNVQGDEPFLPPGIIKQVAQQLYDHDDAAISTLCTPIHDSEEVVNPNVVKVVRDHQGYAMYFSRAPIPWNRSAYPASLTALTPAFVTIDKESQYFRHIGLYAYKAEFVHRYVNYPMSMMERMESLEQLRALENGYKIFAGEAEELPGIGVDTPQDLQQARKILATT